jgi:signal transduction histidine kinase
MVLCEPPAMKEAVANLLVNATKYARGCAVDVSLKTEGEHAVLAIRDEGPGMSDTDRDNAFRRFYRGEFVRDIEGSGLGLSIVDRVVTSARGTIALDTGLGRGTCFTIVLPLAPSA